MNKHRQMKFQNGLRNEWGKSNPNNKQIKNQRIRSKLKRITNKEIKEAYENIPLCRMFS